MSPQCSVGSPKIREENEFRAGSQAGRKASAVNRNPPRAHTSNFAPLGRRVCGADTSSRGFPPPHPHRAASRDARVTETKQNGEDKSRPTWMRNPSSSSSVHKSPSCCSGPLVPPIVRSVPGCTAADTTAALSGRQQAGEAALSPSVLRLRDCLEHRESVGMLGAGASWLELRSWWGPCRLKRGC